MLQIIKNNLIKMLKMFKKCYKIDISEKIDDWRTKLETEGKTNEQY